MGVKLKNITESMRKYFAENKKTSILIVVSMIGIVLIGFSNIFSSRSTSSENSDTVAEVSTDEYISNLESRVNEIISQIAGAGKCRVMITVKSSLKQEYATDKSVTDDIERSSGRNSERTQRQTEVVMIEDSNGRKNALKTKSVEPEIKGVLIVCEGAENVKVKESLINAVTTVLNISSNKVCIVKSK